MIDSTRTSISAHERYWLVVFACGALACGAKTKASTPAKAPTTSAAPGASASTQQAGVEEGGWWFAPLQGPDDVELANGALLVDERGLVITAVDDDDRGYVARGSAPPWIFRRWPERPIDLLALTIAADGAMFGSGVRRERLDGALPYEEIDVRLVARGEGAQVESRERCGYRSYVEPHAIVATGEGVTRARTCGGQLRVERYRDGGWQVLREDPDTGLISLSAAAGRPAWIVVSRKVKRELPGAGSIPVDQYYGGDVADEALQPLDSAIYLAVVEYSAQGELLLAATRHAPGADSQLVFSKGSPYGHEVEVVAEDRAVSSLCTVGEDSRARPFIIDDHGVWTRRGETWSYFALPESIAYISECAWGADDRVHLLVGREAPGPDGQVRGYTNEYATAAFEG